MTEVTPTVDIIPDVGDIVPDEVTDVFRVIGSEGLWLRGGVIFAGTILIIIGIVIMISGTRAVKQAASLVTSVASKGIVK